MLRIYDANLNRVGEGLRVLEEVARFLLNDPDLTERLKSMRHELVRGCSLLESQLLSSRNSEGDVGVLSEVPGEAERRDIPAIVTANARRVQESLRVLEEFSKIPNVIPLDSARIKQTRFELYQLEQRLLSKLLRREKIGGLTGLYLIIDQQALQGRSEVEVAQRAIQGGVRVIQLRDKQRSKGELLEVARELNRLCAEHGVLFIVNDYLDLALAADADGVHLGQGDLPVAVARKILPIDKIVGCSTATLEEALRAQEQGADYIAVGSIYPTLSKAATRAAGLEMLRRVKEAVSIPVIAIGGINEDNVAQVITAGADAVAVINAVLATEDVEAAARRLASRIEAQKHSLKGGIGDA